VNTVMQGIRVLEVADHTFVPAASAILADWGADVIKIEHPVRGDAMRGLAATGVMNFGGGVHVILEHSNRGKRSLGLDLSRDEGLEVLYKLAATADVFLVNKPPSTRQKLRVDVEHIRPHNPSIVYVRGTAYGSKGPDADKGGYDMTAYWCRSGNAVGAQPAGVDWCPIQPAPGYGDSLGAMTIAGGIAAALLHRERTGEGVNVDVSLLGTGIWAMGAAVALSEQLKMPWRQPPIGGGRTAPGNPLVGMFRTKDDRWLNLTMLQAFQYWPEVCRVLGRLELVDDERFATAEALAANAGDAQRIVQEGIGQHTLDEWKQLLVDFKGQWAPVQDSLEVIDDPQTVANGYVLGCETADGRPFKLATTPVQFGDEPAPPKRAPDFNEHGDAILTDELGLDWDTVMDLKVKGVVA
jgi:crotonobetainyl-CoA:carnitine CoA-transferase CaiB-like acyl-CoA transferase